MKKTVVLAAVVSALAASGFVSAGELETSKNKSDIQFDSAVTMQGASLMSVVNAETPQAVKNDISAQTKLEPAAPAVEKAKAELAAEMHPGHGPYPGEPGHGPSPHYDGHEHSGHGHHGHHHDPNHGGHHGPPPPGGEVNGGDIVAGIIILGAIVLWVAEKIVQGVKWAWNKIFH